MRILEYRMQLTGDYLLTNYPLARDSEDTGSAIRSAIQLIVEQCADWEAFVENFDYLDEDDEKSVGPLKREVLLGENKDWILTAVSVGKGSLLLEYGNPEYAYQLIARRERIERGEPVDDTPPPFDALAVILSHFKAGATLRFVTPRNDGSGYADTTLVKIPSNPNRYFVVTEFDGHKRRELTFLNDYSPEGDEYVWVREFM